jgi:hypothetical protein
LLNSRSCYRLHKNIAGFICHRLPTAVISGHFPGGIEETNNKNKNKSKNNNNSSPNPYLKHTPFQYNFEVLSFELTFFNNMVSVARKCKKNGSTYSTFRLKQVFDMDAASNHERWDAMHAQLRRLQVNLTNLQLLTPKLKQHLQTLLYGTTVNLTSHRTQVCHSCLYPQQRILNHRTNFLTESNLQPRARPMKIWELELVILDKLILKST